MFKGLDINNNNIDIDKAIKGEKYFCPSCKSELIVKKGQINVHHFAHVSNKDCDSWSEMSEWHKNWQSLFPIECREVSLGKHRADVKVKDLIIEFQKSPLSVDKWTDRINYYSKLGNLVFVVDLRDKKITIKDDYSMYINMQEEIYNYINLNLLFSWENPSRSIPTSCKYNLFFELSNERIAWIKNKKGYSWDKFYIYTVFNKKEFLELLRKILRKEDLKEYALSTSYIQNNISYIFYSNLYELTEELERKILLIIEKYSSTNKKIKDLISLYVYTKKRFWEQIAGSEQEQERAKKYIGYSTTRYAKEIIEMKNQHDNKLDEIKDKIKTLQETYKYKLYNYFNCAKIHIMEIKNMTDEELISFVKQKLTYYFSKDEADRISEMFNIDLSYVVNIVILQDAFGEQLEIFEE